MKALWRWSLAALLLAAGSLNPVTVGAQTSGACQPGDTTTWGSCAPPPSCMTPDVFANDTTQCLKDFAAMCDEYNETVPVAGSFAQTFCNQMAAFTYPPECSPTNGGQHPKACQTAATAECKKFMGGGQPFQDQFCQTFFGTFPAPADGVPAPPPDTWPINGPCNPIDPASWGSCAPPPSCFNPGMGANNPGQCQRDFAAACALYSDVTGTFGGVFCDSMTTVTWPAECGFSSFLADQPACQAAMAQQCKDFQGGGMPMQELFCDTFFGGQIPSGPSNTAPEAGLTANPSSGTAPLPVTFSVSVSDADATDSPTYDLDFGDGTTHATGSESGDVSHTYAAAGSYTATLTVTDGQASDTATQTITVTDQPNTAPTAALTGPATATTNAAVSFDGSGSSDPDGDTLSYTFDLGDGTVVGPDAGSSVNHAYAAAGEYTVTLSVSDGRGGVSTDAHAITVEDEELPPTEIDARLSSDTTGGEIPLTVNFNATGSTGPEGSTLDYTFVFGDGTQSARQVTPWASHTYEAAGTYNAYVIVTDGGANSDVSETVVITATVTVVVTPGQETDAELTANPSSGTAPLTVDFDASQSLPADGATLTNYRFDFDDGTSAVSGTAATVRHVYTEPGDYEALLTVTDSDGGTSTATVTIHVGSADETTAQLVIEGPATGPAPLTVTFDGSRSVAAPGTTIASYTFDYGDGTQETGTTATRQHTYTVAGSYTPTLTVTDSSQGESMAQASVKVLGPAATPATQRGGGSLGVALLMPFALAALGRRRFVAGRRGRVGVTQRHGNVLDTTPAPWA